MEKEFEYDYDAPEQEAEETDAPGSADDDADEADAYRQFLADRRTVRYEDTKSNRRRLFNCSDNQRPAE